MTWVYMTDNDADSLNLFLFDWLPTIIIASIITCFVMYNENQTIVCAAQNCYLHEHSYVCYLGWSVINSGATLLGLAIAEIITGIAIVHNLFALIFTILKSPYTFACFLYRLESARKKPEIDSNTLSKYEKFIKGGK